MMRTAVSRHRYNDAEDAEDTFEVYKLGDKWFWSFSPVWRDAGPFATEALAIKAGKSFVDEDGNPYI